MKKWMQKLVSDLDLDWGPHHSSPQQPLKISEEMATLLFVIDQYSKNLVDVENHSIRKVRDEFDEISKGLLSPEKDASEKALFRFRQFFGSYRIDEYSYIQKTFDDFRNIIWAFVDQLSEDLSDEKKSDQQMKMFLNQLKEAVESNSIDQLKSHSKQFIEAYVQTQSKKEKQRSKRIDTIRKNLDSVKKQLEDTTNSLNFDHLTKAYNRKSFDEQIKNQWNLYNLSNKHSSLIMLDIDFFKKINDTYGHAIGDYVLQECVKLLKEVFHRDTDFIARVGGEEFAILLPDYQTQHAIAKAEAAMNRIRAEVFVKEDMKLSFTVSMGIAELAEGESIENWMKRADMALYESKHTGRNKYTVAPSPHMKIVA